MFHRCGRSSSPGSTRSVAIAVAGRSVSRLIRRIWLASSGRKGSTIEAIAIEIMLPKLALVVM